MKFRFRFSTNHGLVHRVRAKVNSARPFHAAKIGIDGDSVENFRIKQFQEHAAALFGFNRENSRDAVAEHDLQAATRKRLGGNNPAHKSFPLFEAGTLKM